MKKFVIIIVFSIVSLTTGCIKNIAFDVNSLNEMLENNRNEDGGYGVHQEEINGLQDFYTTYYANEILKILGSSNDSNEVMFEKNQSFESMSDVYYYTKIHIENIKVQEVLRQEIYNYLLSLKNEDGTFRENIEVEDELKSYIHYPTYMAIEIITDLNLKLEYKDISKWIDKEIDTMLNDKSFNIVSKISELNIIIDTASLIGKDLTQYEDYFLEYQKNYEDYINNILDTNSEELNVFYIYEYVQFSKFLGITSTNYKNIVGYILNCQNGNGGFGIVPNSDTNVYTTYLSLCILDFYNEKIPLKESLISYLNRYNLKSGMYIEIGEIDSDPFNTLYAYKLSDLLDIKIDKSNLFINSIIKEDLRNLSLVERYLYLYIKDDIDINYVQEIIDKEEYINKIDEKFYLYYILFVLDRNNDEIDVKYTNRIVTFLENNIKENMKKDKSSDDLINLLLDINLLDLINKTDIKNKEIQTIYRQVDEFIINNDEESLEMYYKILILSKQLGYTNKNIKQKMMEIIKSRYYEDGLFKDVDNMDNKPSIEATYMGVWILKNYIN